MIKLPEQVLTEIELLNKKKFIYINQYEDDCIDRLYETVKLHDSVILMYPHETISITEFWDSLYDIINNNKDVDIRIMTSTASSFQNSTHPLTNLLMWKDLSTRVDLTWDFSNSDFIFDKSKYFIGKSLTRTLKNINYIVSTRKENRIRDYIFLKLSNYPHNRGIYRYITYPPYHRETDDDKKRVGNMPSIYELIEEYESSYFSFIIESEHGDSDRNPTTNLTEKTIIAFLTGTIPIFHGGKNYIKELNEMGFYTWNDEFGFGNGDVYSNYSTFRSDLFVNCFDNMYSMTLQDCEKFWDTNREKIQHNYDLMTHMIFNDDLINFKICNTHGS